MEIQAIQTRYNGCHFRSRTEARWAVFFDAVGISWEYEKEAYDLSRWRKIISDLPFEAKVYLPDFWLPEYRAWVEIKGAIPEPHWQITEPEWRLFFLVAQTTARQGWLFFGSPAPFINHSCVEWKDGERTPRLPCRYHGGIEHLLNNRSLTVGHFSASRSARFEFGANGAT